MYDIQISKWAQVTTFAYWGDSPYAQEQVYT